MERPRRCRTWTDDALPNEWVTFAPLIPTKAHIEIPGKQAKIRLHSGDPEFYFRTGGRPGTRYFLMHITAVKGDKRELETSTTNIVGQTNYKGDEMPLLIWDAALSLYRLTVEAELGPANTRSLRKVRKVWRCTFGILAWTPQVQKNNTSIELHSAKSGSNPAK